MRMLRLRCSALASTFVGVVLLAACSDSPAAVRLEPEVIEETTFASSLNIDLASMTRTSSGLYIETIAEGVGEPAMVDNGVTISYTGWLSDGTSFDSGQFPFVLGAGQVVPGFDEGVLGMKVEGIRRVIMPPSLGYGNTARGIIPSGSILIFRLELVDID